MGKLFDEIKSVSALAAQPNRLDELKQQMPEEEYEDMIAAIKDSKISSTVISRVLKSKGYIISGNTVLNWRHRLNND